MKKEQTKLNKMNKSIFLLLGLLCGLLLTGCGNVIPELSEEEMDRVEEYAANLILKYDSHFQSDILTEEERQTVLAELERKAQLELEVQALKELEEQEAEDTASDADGDGESEGENGEPAVEEPKYTDIDDFYGISGFDIRFSRYYSCDTYPANLEDNDWQGVTMATNGCKLIVFEFEAENITDSDQTLDFASIHPVFGFRINHNITKAILSTMQLEDMSIYRGTIPAGATENMVLIIEVSDDVASQLESVVMIMKLGAEKGELTIL
ncbi:MAG: hypothetical protein ACI4DU_03550 [Lachnospiraceae bacterium]